MKRLISILLIVIMAGSFALGQKKSAIPQVQIPTVYRGVPDPSAQPNPQTLANAKWFEVFKDTNLQDLIHEALLHNYDVRAAVARIDEARAIYGLNRSNQYPNFAASADLTTVGQSRS